MSRFFWTQKQDMGPWPRGGHALAYDSGRGRVVLFGGVATVPAPTPSIPNGFTTFNDTWEWTVRCGVRWQISDRRRAAITCWSMTPPASRYFCSVV
jgi:hypothetical protein